MKKICLMTTARYDIAENINLSDTELCVISDNPNDNNYRTSDMLPEYLKSENYELVILADYAAGLPDEIYKYSRFIKIHPSLLPSFDKDTAIRDAYFAGVKVTGVTILELDESGDQKKIITQYPVLIDNFTHYDQLESEIRALECSLLPPVLGSILENKIFDLVDFLKIPSCERYACRHAM